MLWLVGVNVPIAIKARGYSTYNHLCQVQQFSLPYICIAMVTKLCRLLWYLHVWVFDMSCFASIGDGKPSASLWSSVCNWMYRVQDNSIPCIDVPVKFYIKESIPCVLEVMSWLHDVIPLFVQSSMDGMEHMFAYFGIAVDTCLESWCNLCKDGLELCFACSWTWHKTHHRRTHHVFNVVFQMIWWWRIFSLSLSFYATHCLGLSPMMSHQCAISVVLTASGDSLSHPTQNFTFFGVVRHKGWFENKVFSKYNRCL